MKFSGTTALHDPDPAAGHMLVYSGASGIDSQRQSMHSLSLIFDTNHI